MNIVIVEDEPLVQQRIERLSLKILAAHQPRITCFVNLDDVEDFLAEHSIDLLLLDLNLMGCDGFDLLKKNVAAAHHTIVISAYAEKAIEAFEYGVLDFVAKPFTEERLTKAFERFTESSQRSYYGCRYLSIKKVGIIELLAISDIAYIQAEGHYSKIHLNNPSIPAVLHDKNIEKIIQLLPQNFLRIHRSYITNMNLIKRLMIEEGSRYSIQLMNEIKLPIGRTKYKYVKQYIESNIKV